MTNKIKILILTITLFSFTIKTSDLTFKDAELEAFQKRNYEEQLRFRNRAEQLTHAANGAMQVAGGIFNIFGMMSAKQKYLEDAREIEKANEEGEQLLNELDQANIKLKPDLEYLEYLQRLAYSKLILPIEIEVFKSQNATEIVKNAITNTRRIEDRIGMLHGYAIAKDCSLHQYTNNKLLGEIKCGKNHHDKLNVIRLHCLIDCMLIRMINSKFSNLFFMLGVSPFDTAGVSHLKTYQKINTHASREQLKNYLENLAEVIIKIKQRMIDAQSWHRAAESNKTLDFSNIINSAEAEAQKMFEECCADLNFYISVYDRNSGKCLYRGL